ncbi:MAG: DEAD/DEAH box helicase, partial [Candidatus Aenigmarchaeota archaeon]|nr:DEAD/DEAH box helicase [Candidatus Aenigmarchaeota archaeon]
MAFELFSSRLQNLIREKGFIEPTLAQKIGIPEIMKGSNVLIIAPTGIGKTEAAILPLFDKIHLENAKPISVLYVSPLRALNRDLLDRLVWWAEKLELDIAVRHGDTTQTERQAQVEIPPHILISTPEMLNAMLIGKRLREHLKNIKHVVIDEIHELVESKRGIQLSLALERLAELAGPFQRIGLSATVGTPELVAQFLGEKVKIIRAEQEKKYDIAVEAPKPKAKDHAIADDLVIGIETVARLRRLYELITGADRKSVLVFTNTRETAEVLSSRLRQLDKELKQEVHHGSLSKERRIKSEQKFKAQELKSLIATSSLELGIDIGSIDLVVQYLSPRQVSRIIQRVGRAGHSVGQTSKGVLLSGDEDLFESIVIADKAMQKKLEPVKIHESAFDVLASQIMGLAMEYDDISDDKVFRIVKRAYPFRNITKKELDEILQLMSDLHLIWLNPTPLGQKLRRKRKAWTYYFENLSMIPDTVQYRVISIIEGEPVGMLDEEFVAEHGKPGERFICGGRAWKVLSVDNRVVRVEPIEDIESAIPAWEGELIPVPYDIAQGVAELRKFIAQNLGKKDLIEKLRKKFEIDTNAAEEIAKLIEKHKEKHLVPTDEQWLIENYKDFIIIHACNGSLVNDTLGRYLAALLTAETGVSVNVKSDPYRIMIQTMAKPDMIQEILEKGDKLEDVLKIAISRSMLFKQRFLHVARRFGILSRQIEYGRI